MFCSCCFIDNVGGHHQHRRANDAIHDGFGLRGLFHHAQP